MIGMFIEVLISLFTFHLDILVIVVVVVDVGVFINLVGHTVCVAVVDVVDVDAAELVHVVHVTSLERRVVRVFGSHWTLKAMSIAVVADNEGEVISCGVETIRVLLLTAPWRPYGKTH